MSSIPFFSVVIPAYNRVDLLRQALESVAAQEFDDFEVLVVDDGSTEDLSQALESCAGRLTLLRQKNAGPSAARNLGVEAARGEYIAFLDSDDVWFPWTLSAYRRTIDDCHRPAFIAGAPCLFQDPGDLPRAASLESERRVFSDYLASGDEWRWFGVSSFVIRRDVLLEGGCFSREMWYGEDGDLTLRLGTASGFTQVIKPLTFGYRVGSGGQLTDKWEPLLPAALLLLANERSGRYPGGRARARERRRIISRHVRPLAVRLARERQFAAASRLYAQTLAWNISLWNWKFVLGLPAMMAWQKLAGPAMPAGSG